MSAIDLFADARPEVPELTPERKFALAHELFGARSSTEWDAEAVAVGMEPSQAEPTRRRSVAVGMVAALAALIVGLVVVAGDRTPDAPAAPLTEPPTAPAEPLRLLPADPSAYELEAQRYNRPATTAEHYAVLARPADGGVYSDRILVFRGEHLWIDEVDWEGDGVFTQFELSGHTMMFVDDAEGGSRLVQFRVRDGSTVQLSARRPGPAGTFRDELAAIGLGLDLSVEGLELRVPPDGYEIVASGQFLPDPMRTLSVWRADQQYLGVTSTRTSDAGVPFRDMGETIRPVTIRGRDGWVTTSTWRIGDGPWERSSLVWEERPGQWVIVEEMNPATPEELLAFAESLVEVDAEQYAAVVDEQISPPLPADLETSPTTAPATESVADGPATTAPQTAPIGSVLMTSNIVGLGQVYGRQLELQGAEVLEPALIPAGGTGLIEQSRVYARDDASALGLWVAGELGIATVEPFDLAADAAIEADVSAADVVVVLGRDLGLRDGRAIVPFIVGDSLVEISALERRGYLNVGLTTGSLPDEVAFVVAQFSAGVLVVQVATDEPLSREVLDLALTAASDIPNIILVNVDANVPWKQPTNALLAEVDRPDDNIFVLDWDALAEQCPGECFAADGIHLTEVGAEYFADRLGEITGY